MKHKAVCKNKYNVDFQTFAFDCFGNMHPETQKSINKIAHRIHDRSG